jgi:hypothetical protein
MFNTISILFVRVRVFIVIYIPHFIFKYKELSEIKTRLSLAAAQVALALSLKVLRLLYVKGKTCIAWYRVILFLPRSL